MYDTAAIQENLNDIESETKALIILFWICVGFTLLELVFWIIYCTCSMMDKTAQEHYDEDRSHRSHSQRSQCHDTVGRNNEVSYQSINQHPDNLPPPTVIIQPVVVSQSSRQYDQ